MKTLRPMHVRRMVLSLMALCFVLVSATSCTVQKNDFHKKKWSIKKGHPPAQRYYNKWSLFNQRKP